MRRTSLSFARIGGAVSIVVAIVCLLSAPPQSMSTAPFTLLVLSSTAVWIGGLLTPAGRMHWRAVAFTLYGISGAALDLVQPWGPGFVAGFVAVAALALALPLRVAAVASLPVLAFLAMAEAATSAYPWNALLNILLGIGFFFAASAFAAVKRDASVRAEQLLRQEAETRHARDEAAALAERARLARELHDVLAHTLSGLTLQLEAARLLAQRRDTDWQVLEQLELAQRSARNGVLEGKRAIAALRGDALAGPDDVPALVTGFSRDSGIAAALEVEGTPGSLPEDAALAVYRCVQESLSNIRKHAPDSRSVTVRLDWTGPALSVRVVNGGAAPAGPGGAGFGLAGLAERAASSGGDFTAGATADGFETLLTLPLTAAERVS